MMLICFKVLSSMRRQFFGMCSTDFHIPILYALCISASVGLSPFFSLFFSLSLSRFLATVRIDDCAMLMFLTSVDNCMCKEGRSCWDRLFPQTQTPPPNDCPLPSYPYLGGGYTPVHQANGYEVNPPKVGPVPQYFAVVPDRSPQYQVPKGQQLVSISAIL